MQAGSLPIVSTEIEAAYAERVESLERLAIIATELSVFPLETAPRPGSESLAPPCMPDTAADGALPSLPSCVTEMSAAMPLVVTNTAVGNWTYTVSVRERYPASAAEGDRFSVELLLDGVSVGTAEIVQAIAEPLAPEGARVLFDVGREAPLSPQFVVLVRSVEPVAGEHTLRAVTDEKLENVWKGEGAEIDGATNPTLAGAAGEALRIKIRHDDAGGSPHNIRIKSSTGAVVAGPTGDITSDSPNGQLDWTPVEPGTYRYECKYHLTTQFGTIDIT